MLFRAFGNLPRPELWLPDVFASPEDAIAAGFGYNRKGSAGTFQPAPFDVTGQIALASISHSLAEEE
jgi:hypothetical protein